MKLDDGNRRRMGLGAALALALMSAVGPAACNNRRAWDAITGSATPGTPEPGATSTGTATPGSSGTMTTGGATPGSSTPPPGSGTAGDACGRPWRLGASMSLLRAAAGQSYVRCGTFGSEAPWRVSLSRDGSRLAALTSAGTVRLYAVDGWRALAQLAAPVGRIDAVAFSPDGARLATLAGEMGETTLWRAADGALERSFPGPLPSTIDGGAVSLAFSSDGKQLAAALGTVIDLDSGVTTDWSTGQPVTVTRKVNPANLAPGGVAYPDLRFAAGGATLFVDAHSQTGNSPPSTELSVFVLATGSPYTLYARMYDRALLGYAVSRDNRLIAVATSEEAAIAGSPVGLFLYSADTGQAMAGDGSFAGGVLGFSPDGTRLYVTAPAGDAVQVRDSGDLHLVSSFPWSAGARFLAVSPAGLLVAAAGTQTSWLDPATGQVARTVSYVLSNVTWSGDGTFGAGSAAGDGALFHFWRESDGTELCAPIPAPPEALPPGVVLAPTAPDPVTSGDAGAGAVVARSESVIHAHSLDWYALRVTEAGAGAELRVFGAVGGEPTRAAFSADGARLYTSASAGAGVAVPVPVWCR